MDDIKTLLDEAIKDEITGLKKLQTGSAEKSKAISDLSNLHQMRVDELKVESARQEQADRNELERDKYFLDSLTRDDERVLKEAQYKSQKFDRWLNFGLVAGQALMYIVAYDIWNRRGFKFEEEGTINSPQNRNLLSKMIPSLRK